MDHAIEHSFVREAVVPERKLVTEALKRGLGAVTVEGVQPESEQAAPDPQRNRRPPDGDDERNGGLESRLIEFARNGRGRCRPLADAERAVFARMVH